MKGFFKFLTLGFLALVLSGCVVTQYKNEKGEDCTRRYFTVCGISTHSCVKGATAVAPDKVQGKEVSVPAALPSKPESAVEKAMEQEIQAATQVPVIPKKKIDGEEIKIAPAAPGTPASRSSPADTVKQSIKSAVRVR